MNEKKARATVSEAWSAALAADHRQDGPCVEWTGTRNRAGYGVARRNGEFLAPRAVWVEANGLIPAGLVIRHRCDNPPCINRGHLLLGTRTDNNNDKMERDRNVAPTGELNGRTTIPDLVVAELRARAAGGASYKSLARELGVHPVTVSRICRGLRRVA